MHRSAYTLMELLLVLAILVMLAAVAVPSMQSMYLDVRLDGAVDQIRASWAEARAAAMEEGRPYTFAIKPESSEYRVAPDRVEFWSGQADPTTSDIGLDRPPTVIEDELVEDILFKMADGASADASGWIKIGTFLPDGTCRDDFTLEVQMEELRPRILRVRGLTGAVSVEKGERNAEEG